MHISAANKKSKLTIFVARMVFVVLFMMVNPAGLFAQNNNSTDNQLPVADSAVPELHSAHKATLYSLMLPGLGQAYNEKYWKIPVIYVGFGLLAYNFKINNDETKKFTEAYRYVINNDSFPTDNEYVARYKDDSGLLLRGRDYYRRRVELSVIFSALWYILNVIDATVDAHFFNYDVSDNLSLRIDPVFMMPTGLPGRQTSGLRLSMSF